MWRWYVGLSGVIVTRCSTSFQVYGLISQEPYIYKSVTTETKSIKSLTSVSDKLWYNLYVGLTEQATCISCSHLVVEGHVVWYIRPCCLMRDNIYCRRIRRGVYAMHHTYYIDPSLSHHHHCHSYILVISHSYISLLMSLACHNSVIIYKTLYSPCHFYDVYSPTHIIYSMLLCENREGVHGYQ